MARPRPDEAPVMTVQRDARRVERRAVDILCGRVNIIVTI